MALYMNLIYRLLVCFEPRIRICRQGIRLWIASYIFLAVPMINFCQAQSKLLIKTVDSLVRHETNSTTLAGAVVLIKHKGRIIHCQAYGSARRYDDDQKRLTKEEVMTDEHLFDLASLTKVVATTTGIMMLIDQHKLKPDDAVSRFIPEFSSQEKQTITVRHLLTHTSGMTEWYPMYYRANTRQEAYRLISELPLKYQIGQERHYSDLGFTILGQIIEVVSKQPLERFVQEAIFTPLRMKQTMYLPVKQDYQGPIAATSLGNPYEKRMVYDPSLGFKVPDLDPDSWTGWRNYILIGEVNDGNAWYAGQGVSGAAGLFATVKDLQTFLDFIMHPERTKLIAPSVIRQFLTQDKWKNGLGWMMDPGSSFMKNAPTGTFGHTGFTGTSLVVIPSADLSMIFLTNRQHTGLNHRGEYYNVGALREKLFKALLDYLHEKQ